MHRLTTFCAAVLVLCAASAFAPAAAPGEATPPPTKPEPTAPVAPAPVTPDVAEAEVAKPDAATPAAEATVTPAAAAVLDQVAAAYSKLKSLDQSGLLSGEFDIAGQKDTQQVNFNATFVAPNKFRHELKDESVVGSTGEKLYVHFVKPNIYDTAAAPAAKVMSDELPGEFANLIGSQNLSLILAMSKDPAGELKKSYRSIDKAADVKVGETSFVALAMSNPKGPAATLLFDPSTHLLRRAMVDVSSVAKERGAPDVKKATVTIDYATSTADAAAATASKPEQFAWAPPAGAKSAQELQQQQGEAGGAAELEGKPAPDFKLKGLDDKDVALKDLKGSVVVLDFWATWCGPCVASLPKIDKLYNEKKEQGVKVFAVNEGEDKELVSGFMKSKKLSLPALLDSDSKVGQAYKAEAIPQTVVINKDGTVRKVFVGAGPNTERELGEAIDAALKAAK